MLTGGRSGANKSGANGSGAAPGPPDRIAWSWRGVRIDVGLDRRGDDGPAVLLLPALSTIATRGEMRPLAERLAERARVVAVDWPGFGDADRRGFRPMPDALSAFLAHLLDAVVPDARLVVAAGHAAFYLLGAAAASPGRLDRVALVAPTWRGPLPTMANGDRTWFRAVRRLIEWPVTGPLLYRLNTHPVLVRRMVSGHVYADPSTLSGALLDAKRRVMAAPGARFGTAAFVTGGLDRVDSRQAALDLARAASVPILLVAGPGTPPKSRAEMDALAALPNVTPSMLPAGKLAPHEEYPDAVAGALLPFLLGSRPP